MPTYISSLYKLAQKIPKPDDDCQQQFHSLMELMANIIVQKSRFCRLDFEMFARLVHLYGEQVKGSR
jgi:hypothetical protein